jgi:hypothetical protein
MRALRNVLLRATWLVLLLCLVALPIGFANAQECGDVNLDGVVDGIDFGKLMLHLYGDREPLAKPELATFDGVPGVTQNDLLVMIRALYITLEPLDCSVVPDTSYPESNDYLECLNVTVPPGHSVWDVELWLGAIGPYQGVSIPFSYSCTTSAITLDSITCELAGEFAVYHTDIDSGLRQAIVPWFCGSGAAFEAGKQLVASLHFSLESSPEPQLILIDTSSYPPGHTTVLTRPLGVPGEPSGFAPRPGAGWESPDTCYATGDVDGNEDIDIGDLTTLMAFLSGFHGPSGPLYVADVTGDCIVDALDFVALACFMPQSYCDPPSLPVATCCEPAVYHSDDTALAMGEADIISAGDTMMVVNNVGASGNDGVRLYVDDISPLKLLAQSDSSRGISMELSNVDLSVDSASIFFEVNGDVVDIVPGKSMAGLEDLQLVGLAGVVNDGRGALQIIGDFTPVGDLNVFVRVYQGGSQTGEATVTGGDVIALGNDAGNGLPQVLHVSIYTAPPPAVIIYLDRVTRFTLVDGPILFGDEIHLIARSATKTVLRGRTYDVTGGYLGWFGISKFDPDVCCRGFMGNADCDIVDMVDIGDVTEMIRMLFINVGTQFCCEEEADLDYVAPIDVGDLTVLIKHLFIDVTPPPPCP